MELSKLQQEILNKSDGRIFVNAAASSGKTNLLTAKIEKSIKTYDRVVAFTFTNMAAAEIKSRLNCSGNENLFVGTIHSYCYRLLASHGITEAREAVDKENFDELFKLIVKYPYCLEKIDMLICDEAQDTGEKELEIIFKYMRPVNFFFVYDTRQTIYRFRGSNPELLIKYGVEAGAKIYSMNENYRNGSEILKFAKKIINKNGMSDDSIPMRKCTGQIIEVFYNPNSIASTIKSRGNYKNWAILARTNNEVNGIISALRANDVPYDTFKQGDLDKEELAKKMDEDTVKVLTIHSSKGLEWDNVVVIGARFYSEGEINVCYVAATRARNLLVWTEQKKKKKKVASATYNWE